jgi:NAD+--asparagine ADP-ribosyltransferase
MESSLGGSLVRVWTDVGSRKPVPLLAKIVEENGVIFTIRYLSESDDKIWRYEEDTYEVDDESIAEYLKTSDECDVGFASVDDGFVKVESDDDYVPSDEEDEDEDEESDIFTSEDEDEEAEFQGEGEAEEEDDDSEEDVEE